MGTNAALRRQFRPPENKTTILSYPERMVARWHFGEAALKNVSSGSRSQVPRTRHCCSSMFDFISAGEGRVPLAWSLVRLACIAESISVSADVRASWSDDLMAPDFTSDSNSSCNFWRGDW